MKFDLVLLCKRLRDSKIQLFFKPYYCFSPINTHLPLISFKYNVYPKHTPIRCIFLSINIEKKYLIKPLQCYKLTLMIMNTFMMINKMIMWSMMIIRSGWLGLQACWHLWFSWFLVQTYTHKSN